MSDIRALPPFTQVEEKGININICVLQLDKQGVRPCCLLPLHTMWWLSLSACRRSSEKQNPSLQEPLLALEEGSLRDGLGLVWPLI